MNNLLIELFNELGLGIGAYVTNIDNVKNRIENILNKCTISILNDKTLELKYKDSNIKLHYIIENNSVRNLTIEN